MHTLKTVKKTGAFQDWYDGLRDHEARFRIQIRIDRAQLGNYGDVKSVGSGVLEMRIHYGPGYRVYMVERGKQLIVLLAGGTKKGQEKDIKRAQQLAQEV
jgi:putative addiction module killer protein